MDGLFKTLGDQNRLRMINLLRKSKLCVCEMEVILNTTQSNVSRHLARLRSENVITYEKKAQWIYYSIHEDFIKKHHLLFKYLEDFMDQEPLYQDDLKRLQEYESSGENCETLKRHEKKIFAS
ncbi:ArsR/SmtB family transcription factor [Anoxynatronum buryatiense]|uniref:Transcriptional regulator, ArsR family n=1 Tax=Anoxynatronum buryatiense TaxID=489973 RepID=A0AA45WTD6_9CLOT|nr:metalloregulator ArsR/SmtB family transcription factor [Anoxynatronum buryatiense]SMP41716.1 transcriptional regulator, ArsR family [Anoxynatronum buryatiense]